LFPKKADSSISLNDFPNTGTVVNEDKIFIDINGDGEQEYITQIEKNSKVYLQLYSQDGTFMAGMWNDNTLMPAADHQVLKLSSNSSKEYLRWDQAVGPHEIETLVFTLFSNKLHPVYSYNSKKQMIYAPFYTSRGSLEIRDFDSDGALEVVEFVDEYPVNAPRLNDPEIEAQVKDIYRRQNLDQEMLDGILKIIRRENNGLGRGKKVIWGIHEFVDSNPPSFLMLQDAELVSASNAVINTLNDKTAGTPVDEVIPFSRLTKDSIDFNHFVRKFWTMDRTYEFSAK
jgi:hypothetical protein